MRKLIDKMSICIYNIKNEFSHFSEVRRRPLSGNKIKGVINYVQKCGNAVKNGFP